MKQLQRSGASRCAGHGWLSHAMIEASGGASPEMNATPMGGAWAGDPTNEGEGGRGGGGDRGGGRTNGSDEGAALAAAAADASGAPADISEISDTSEGEGTGGRRGEGGSGRRREGRRERWLQQPPARTPPRRSLDFATGDFSLPPPFPTRPASSTEGSLEGDEVAGEAARRASTSAARVGGGGDGGDAPTSLDGDGGDGGRVLILRVSDTCVSCSAPLGASEAVAGWFALSEKDGAGYGCECPRCRELWQPHLLIRAQGLPREEGGDPAVVAGGERTAEAEAVVRTEAKVEAKAEARAEAKAEARRRRRRRRRWVAPAGWAMTDPSSGWRCSAHLCCFERWSRCSRLRVTARLCVTAGCGCVICTPQSTGRSHGTPRPRGCSQPSCRILSCSRLRGLISAVPLVPAEQMASWKKWRGTATKSDQRAQLRACRCIRQSIRRRARQSVRQSVRQSIRQSIRNGKRGGRHDGGRDVGARAHWGRWPPRPAQPTRPTAHLAGARARRGCKALKVRSQLTSEAVDDETQGGAPDAAGHAPAVGAVARRLALDFGGWVSRGVFVLKKAARQAPSTTE